MTRRDTIIITVLVNTGLLAVLLAMAILTDDEKLGDASEVASPIVAESNTPPLQQQINIAHYESQPAPQTPVDEVDSALNEYVSQGIAYHGANQLNTLADDDDIDSSSSNPPTNSSMNSPQIVDVTVKKGDALEKIARANGTTVAAIKKLNNLKTEKLNIGQVLKVPVSNPKSSSTSSATPNPTAPSTLTPTPSPSTSDANAAAPVADGTGPVYYTIKSGDNPSTIAKQFGTNTEDLLKLNNMTKDSARNLKVGNKIRIK